MNAKKGLVALCVSHVKFQVNFNFKQVLMDILYYDLCFLYTQEGYYLYFCIYYNCNPGGPTILIHVYMR